MTRDTRIFLLSFLLTLLLLPEVLLGQGSVLLVGGGSENYNDWSDAPYRWLVTHAPNRKIAVLHYSDTTTFFTGYFPWLSPCIVSNRQITSTTQANDSATYRFILQHDGIFLRGGDQAQYVRFWKGTLTQQALKEVFMRGGVIGGTSAGEMVLSDVAYTGGNSDNGALLCTPTGSITLVDDFLSFVPGVLAESHTNERGRLGRLPVFLARYKEASGRSIIGIGVDANSALGVGANGIAEVFGGSAVSFLRWTTGTQYVIEPGKPFSLRDMLFDQLLPGSTIDLKSGSIQLPTTATAFVPKQFTSPPGPVILDGSGKSSDWSASTGSLQKFVGSVAHPTDTIGIFASPGTPTSANAVAAALASLGRASRFLWANEAQKNDPTLAAAGTSCGGFVFAGCVPDSLARFLDASTVMGQMFWAKVASGTPLLFVSEDVMLAGEKVLAGIYLSYSAYYGTLTHLPGLNVLRGIQPIPRFYQNSDNTTGYTYSESRIMGMFWSMAKQQLPLGLLIDAGAYATVTGQTIEAGGVSATSTPLILFDARTVRSIEFPVFHRPGKPNAVQNAAIVGASMHILRTGESLSILTDAGDPPSAAPRGCVLENGYPNPFNPSTILGFELPVASHVTLAVYDLLGRQVVVLIDQEMPAGAHKTLWDASGFGCGVYLARLDHSGASKSTRLVLLK